MKKGRALCWVLEAAAPVMASQARWGALLWIRYAVQEICPVPEHRD